MKSLLVIAGTDSSGGAGLIRDMAVAQKLGFHVKPVVTAVTAQSDDELYAHYAIPPAMVSAQITAAFASVPPVGVKVGMLRSDEIVDAVFHALVDKNMPIILDPVLKTSSGKILFSGKNLQKLFPLLALLTPNIDEAEALTNRSKAVSHKDIAAQAGDLQAQGARAVLMKGGHIKGAYCVDYLFSPNGNAIFSGLKSPKTQRGTGCAIATAIACYLSDGRELKEACALASYHIRQWVKYGRLCFENIDEQL